MERSIKTCVRYLPHRNSPAVEAFAEQLNINAIASLGKGCGHGNEPSEVLLRIIEVERKVATGSLQVLTP
jgi:hypothetical protein